ncbi:MAG: hypothetical protein HYR72_24335 [Deltaproteobacteria bacterium]|nr:hypothetical protein [Deltaproteobacteria bacterium]MBI3389231.1 hypothetical protein [Deltaproteobacteria bacterium]
MLDSGVQHCPACRSEFIAGVAACTDCGGPLELGALPDLAAVTAGKSPIVYDSPDTLLTTLPGVRADLVVRALVMEGIACLLECEGQTKLCGPTDVSQGPFAVTLPVAIYVSGSRMEEAVAVVQSLDRADLVGVEWSEGDPVGLSAEFEGEAERDAANDDESQLQYAGPLAEDTTHRLIVLLAIVAAVLTVSWVFKP